MNIKDKNTASNPTSSSCHFSKKIILVALYLLILCIFSPLNLFAYSLDSLQTAINTCRGVEESRSRKAQPLCTECDQPATTHSLQEEITIGEKLPAKEMLPTEPKHVHI